MEAAAIQAAASSAPAVLPSIAKHAAYPFKVSENMKHLESAVRELEALENDVLTVRKSSGFNCDFPGSTVDEWLNKVINVKTEADDIIKHYHERIRFIHKLGPDYIISRKADKILPEVKNLCNNQIINNLISHAQASNHQPPPSPGIKFNLLAKSGKEFEISVRRLFKK